MRKATATAPEEKRLAQLRALADPTRLKILALLKKPGCCSMPEVDDRRGGMCVCDLLEPLRLTQPTITHHLKVLREASLVECRRIGPWLYCRLNERALKDLGVAIMNL
jgi:ArsR family transcriptional regulator